MEKTDIEIEESTAEQQGSTAPSIPFDILTFLRGLWRRRMILLGFFAVSLVAGYLAASLLGSREYRATALMLYDPPPMINDVDVSSQLSLHTLIDLIKSRETLNAIRERLKLSARIKTIAASISIELRRKTTLLEIKTSWEDAKIAANLANATYECFFEQLTSLQHKKRKQALQDIENRLTEVKDKLTLRDKELEKFTLDHHIVDLDIEAQSYLQQLVTMNIEYDRAVSHWDSLNKQLSTIDTMIEDFKRADKEESSASQSSSVTEANVKIGRLQEMISEEKTSRARLADLAVKKEDLKRAKKLRELDAISQSDYDKVIAEYKRTEALSHDSENIVGWKEKIKKLNQEVVPDSGSVSTFSGDMLRSVMLKKIDIQLEKAASKEEVKSLDTARQRVQKRLEQIPKVKQMYTERLRRIEALVRDRKTLQNMVASITRKLNSSQIPFRIVSRAIPPMFPKKSNRKIIFIGLVFLINALGVFLVIVLELLDFTIKSRGSLAAALPAPVLAVLPRLTRQEALLPGNQQPATHIKEYRRLALALRRRIPQQGHCILITAASHGVGTSTVSLNLAARLQLSGEKILIIDGHTQPPDEIDQAISVADFVEADPMTLKGLGDYLAADTMTAQNLPYPLLANRGSAIVCSHRVIIPEMLNSLRMRELIEKMKAHYSLILIDAPSLADTVDAECLSEYADAILFVVRSGKTNILQEKRCYSRLAHAKAPIIGTILTDVYKLYV